MEWAGLGQGIVQGMQMANEGMIKRQQIQQEATKTESYLQTQNLQQQNYSVQIEQAQAQLLEMQKQMAKRDTWDVLSGYEQTRDASILNTIKQNPIMNDLLQKQGIVGFSNINDLSEEKINSLGITQDMLQDPTKRIAIATMANGQQVPMNMMSIYATTGFLPKLGEQKLAEISLKSAETKSKIADLQYEDMTKWLQANPDKTYNDYVAISKAKAESDTAEIKNLKFMSEQTGKPVSQLIEEKQQAKDAQAIPASIKTKQYNEGVVNTIKDEAKVENLYDVDYTMLSKENKTRFDDMVKADAKNIKPEEYDALTTLQSAADKLNVDDLKDTTGIVDATFNKILDTLGMDLPDNELVQSANYNLIKNAIVKAAMGSQVTGNELERMTAQLGTEFKADKTVRIKMAETLDNLVAKYEGYKTIAPALYARSMKNNVNNMKTISNYLRNPERGKGGTTKTEQTTSTSQYKIGQVVTNTKDNTKWQFLGGDASNKNNWKKVN